MGMGNVCYLAISPLVFFLLVYISYLFLVLAGAALSFDCTTYTTE